MNPIILLLQILLLNLLNQDKKTPVRLHKKQEGLKLTTQEIEIITIILFIVIISICMLLLLTTSCTESGLLYNVELA